MLEKYQKVIDIALKEFIAENSSSHSFQSIEYILKLKAKRIRPALLLMSADLFGGDFLKCRNQALAIELFHNFTLLHDDIMDKAPLRRGKASVHTKWNINTAILSGDFLYAYSLESMFKDAGDNLNEIMYVFNKTSLEVCEGQALDMQFEDRQEISIDEYIKMISLKTAVLLACSLKIGSILSSANNVDKQAIYNFGLYLGIAFQMKDDVLDVYGKDNFGKRIGGDILENKKTILYVLAYKYGDNNHKKILSDSSFKDDDERVSEVINIYKELEILHKSDNLIDKYYNLAHSEIDKLSLSKDKKDKLYQFAEHIISRKI